MTSPMIRPGMVRALLDGVAGSLGSGEAFRRAISGATLEEQRLAASLLARDALDRAARTDTVLDLTMRQLASFAAIWAAVSQWDVALDPGQAPRRCPEDHSPGGCAAGRGRRLLGWLRPC
jgi:hypothetical protein